MATRLTSDAKAEAVVGMGMVRLTQFDERMRVAGCDVVARNLDTAQVRFERAGGVLVVVRCHHRSGDGPPHDHPCEGHKHGHVCYHARAGLMFAALVVGASVTFHATEAAARLSGGVAVPVSAGGRRRAVWAAYRAKSVKLRVEAGAGISFDAAPDEVAGKC